jgi:DNA integrity scanning protein DisA with diadenylate cyclase activity
VASWVDKVTADDGLGSSDVVRALLEFAVHDLGSRGIGALLIYRPSGDRGPVVESRLPSPPPLQILRPTGLAPLRHALAQIDGAAVFDADGVLRELGARLVPSTEAEASVDGLRGMRHTAGRRYSYDDPTATVIVVSEDGPVSVVRGGEVLGSSARA